MESNGPEAGRAAGVMNAPILENHATLMVEEKAPFTASAREQIAALIMYVAAYVFFRLVMAGPWREWEIGAIEAAFGAVFAGLVELVNRGRPRLKESWVWLGCYAAVLAACGLRRFAVWEEWQTALILGAAC